MAKTTEEHKSKMNKEYDTKSTNTAFLLMFPAVIMAGIAVYYAPSVMSFVTILLAIYQFIMLKRFILDFYHMK